jgi:predicted aspartyl protease
VKAGQLKGYSCWLCHLPELQIEDIKLVDWPTFYLKPNQVSLDILPVQKKDPIIIGLPLLRKFKYIQFDNVNRQVEFSLDESFQPQRLQFWQQYPLTIEEDFHGNAFLFVEIPVNGQLLQLQVDTGSGKALALSRQIWQKISQNLQPKKLTKAKDIYPYIGTLPCSKAIIPKLEIGTNIVEDAEVSIFPDDSPLLEEDSGLLGMQYFQNTVLVLDFENNLLWLKNTKSRFL